MMGDGRISTTLKEVLADVIDYRGRTPKKLGGDFSDEGIPVISAKNVKNGSLDFSEGIRYVNPEMYERWMSKKLREGDVLLTSEAPLGQAILLTNESNYCLGQRLYGLRVDSTKLDSRFFYFLLISEPVQRRFQARATGSTAKGIKQSALLEVHIEFPPLPEQRAIAHVLQTIQEAKAARQRELTLERERKAALMDYLFSYGTKGEPRKETEIGEIPESWEVVRLEKLCACLDSKRVPVKQSERNERKGNIPYYGASGQTGWIDDYLFDAPLLLVAEDGENLVSRKLPIAYSIEGKSWVNNHAHVLRITDINQFFLEYYFNSIDLSPYLSGTTRPKLNKASLLGIPISRPSRVETDEIALVLSSCDTKIAALEQEAARLEELFHAMLGELMTGKRSAVPLIDAELPK